jgi:hypothetical protein
VPAALQAKQGLTGKQASMIFNRDACTFCLTLRSPECTLKGASRTPIGQFAQQVRLCAMHINHLELIIWDACHNGLRASEKK